MAVRLSMNAENDDNAIESITTDGSIESLSETTDRIMQTLIEPALDGLSDAVTLPDSDNMLSMASVEHDLCPEEDETCTTDAVHESIAPDGAALPGAPTVQAPGTSRIIKFAIPAMGVWLCSPILSMIDTSAVGLLAGTAQQAALNPAVSVTDYGGTTF